MRDHFAVVNEERDLAAGRKGKVPPLPVVLRVEREDMARELYFFLEKGGLDPASVGGA